MPETRSAHQCAPAGKYRSEMTSDQHGQLLDSLKTVKGRVLLSGYESEMYAKVLRSWRVCWEHRVACMSGTTNNRRNADNRVEVLWVNWSLRTVAIRSAADNPCPRYDRAMRNSRACRRHRVRCTSASVNGRVGFRKTIF